MASGGRVVKRNLDVRRVYEVKTVQTRWTGQVAYVGSGTVDTQFQSDNVGDAVVDGSMM